ncbi:Uncharacterised protein [Legionella busanensis]|uniref:Uncharacterized protein n=1 Tax=Legionella busanensis TaxID=190655 RepID=A0A378JJU7_9GAMM|nr:hypothetical protein [Legionella busanensis]STX51505.1 Uncharacterised protein [Legionella busanensis]
MSTDDDIQQRLSRLAGSGIHDTLSTLLKDLAIAQIEAKAATTPETIKNCSQELNDLIRKLVSKSHEIDDVVKQVELQSKIAQASLLIKELNENKNSIELRQETNKLRGLPEKTTQQALQNLKEAKKEVRGARTADNLRKSIDNLEMAIQIANTKMLDAKGKDKPNLFEQIRQANQCLANYKVLQAPSRALSRATSSNMSLEAKTAAQNTHVPKQKSPTRPANSFKSGANKQLAKTTEITQKQSIRNPLEKRLARAKIEAREAEEIAKKAISKYNKGKTPKARREILKLLREKRAKKQIVASLQKQVQTFETIEMMRGKTTQFKNALHDFKAARQKSSNDKFENNNPRFKP